MRSPRTSVEFFIDPVGLENACSMTWTCTPENFVTMARLIFGLPPEGTPPFWYLLEIAQIVQERLPDATPRS